MIKARISICLLISDVPRSRLVKYPLLIKQVMKYSDCPNDCALLQSAIEQVEIILKVRKIGNYSDCALIQSAIESTSF